MPTEEPLLEEAHEQDRADDDAARLFREADGESPLARCLAELTQLALDHTDSGVLLAEVARTCERAFAFPVAVSITLGDPSEPQVVAADSKQAQLLDGAQMLANEGPSKTAWLTGRTVTSRDLTVDRRWPRLAGQVRDRGTCAAVGTPLRVGDTAVGVLNVYGGDARLVDHGTEESVTLLAATVAALVHETNTKSDLLDLSTQLQQALESRATIEQAKGMIVAMRRCTPDEAFEQLVSLSSNANLKLREVAARMVQQAARGRR
jgi:transcriptional regulator with GAF, ATPase, and Fis domain